MAAQRSKPAPQREPLNALTRLLPHQAGPLCYASEGPPITFPLTDIPADAEPRTLTIRRVMLELSRVEFPADALTPAETQHHFSMVLEAQDRKSRFMASGSCETETMHDFSCGVDCDGGSVHLELAQDGALTFRVSEDARRFRLTASCGSGHVLHHDAATPAFRLVRARPAVCRSIKHEFAKRR